jgi:hypothetical protein
MPAALAAAAMAGLVPGLLADQLQLGIVNLAIIVELITRYFV